MHLFLFAFGLLCAAALWRARHETRAAIERMPSVVLLIAYPIIRLTHSIEWWRLWIRREVFIVLALALTVLGACACAPGQAEARTRTSLDVLAAVIEPAWALAEDSCIASQKVATAREGAGLAKPEETDAALSFIRSKCDAVTSVFEQMRTAHIQAGALLDQGQITSAQDLLDQILRQWQSLQGVNTTSIANLDGGSS